MFALVSPERIQLPLFQAVTILRFAKTSAVGWGVKGVSGDLLVKVCRERATNILIVTNITEMGLYTAYSWLLKEQ